ncbi:MAG: heavy metal translocating P-type ATPase [Bacteroidales bacterium]
MGRNIIENNYPVLNMSCAGCALGLEKIINSLEGVNKAEVSFASNSAYINFDSSVISIEEIRKETKKLGFDILLDSKEGENQRDEIIIKENKKLRVKTFASIILSIPIVLIGMVFMNMPYGDYISWLLSTPVLFIFGRDFFVKGFKAIRNKSANMDTLVALSTGIAYLFSVYNILFKDFLISNNITPHIYFEAASVIISFILLGRLLESKAKGNTQEALKKLLKLQPRQVRVKFDNDNIIIKDIEDLKIGDIVVVTPGEAIAVDGEVISGESYVDESMLSGESMPVKKEKGEMVYAGTINQKGSLYFSCLKLGNETLLSQIIEKVRKAQASKPPVQKLVDKIASIFVPTIIIISILSFALWAIFSPSSILTHGLISMVTVLIIACPCALGLATPTAIMVGIGLGANKGILIKDAQSLEIGKKVDTIVFDKTGTLTIGKPSLNDELWAKNIEEEKSKLRDILVSIEKHSEHPFSGAIIENFQIINNYDIFEFENIPGRGIKAKIEDIIYFIGNYNHMKENNISLNKVFEEKAESWSKEAKSLIYFANEKGIIALFSVSDKIKPSTPKAIKTLKEKGIEIYLLSGDNENTSRAIANKIGIENYIWGVLPEEKADFINSLQQKGKVVAMVGDGVNDSGALAQADLSIAMGKGSDISMDISSATIISSDLEKIPILLNLSAKTIKTIKQNLFWAFIYNIIGIPIAAGILYPINGFLLNPMIAGAAMALSSISVVANSLRLKNRMKQV